MASPSPSLCGYRIMVVEDNFLVAESLCDILTENGCKIVGPVSRLAQGLKLAADATITGPFSTSIWQVNTASPWRSCCSTRACP